MDLTLSLWFDKTLEATIRGYWSELARQRICTTLSEGPYRPHITLGVWRVDHSEQFIRKCEEFCESVRSFQIKFASVGQFPGEEGAAFLQPVVTESLLELHKRIHNYASKHAEHISKYYGPGIWVPHCTMVWKVPTSQILLATDYLLSLPLPLTGWVSAIGVIETPAEIELNKIALLA